MSIIDDYQEGVIKGWAGVDNPELAEEAFNLAVESGVIRPSLQISGQTRETAGRKMGLYLACRKVLGKDTENYRQQIGDCVSFAMKNVAEYLQACHILMHGKSIKWRPAFPPYFYGTGRTYVGKGQLGNGDGSMGAWMAEAAQKYGCLFADEEGVPQYAGGIAKKWGDPNPGDDLDKWKPTAIKYLFKTVAAISTWDELVAAIVNGYPCHTCSNIGYQMEPDSDGFHRQSGSWAHAMTFIGVNDEASTPYALILNSWGDAHGKLKDEEGNPLPVGVLRVKKSDALKHLQARETYAFSQFDGFPEQDLDKNLFDLI